MSSIKGGEGLYRGHYDRQTPPGYSGVAFVNKQEENPPTPVENGAGEMKNQIPNTPLARPPLSGASADRRNEVKTMPRDFSGAAQESGRKETQAVPTASLAPKAEDKALYESLSAFFGQKFSLEELLLIGTALLLATKEEKGDAFPVFALALMLLGS